MCRVSAQTTECIMTEGMSLISHLHPDTDVLHLPNSECSNVGCSYSCPPFDPTTPIHRPTLKGTRQQHQLDMRQSKTCSRTDAEWTSASPLTASCQHISSSLSSSFADRYRERRSRILTRAPSSHDRLRPRHQGGNSRSWFQERKKHTGAKRQR